MTRKIFWGVFGALVAFTMLISLAARFAAWQAAKEAQEQLNAFTAAAQAQQEKAEQARRYQQALDLSRRRLASNQRCLGGTIVSADGNAYTQVLGRNGPVKCTGNLASEPIR